MLLGFGDPFSFKTAMFLALVHGFYKGALFMVAGTIDHATGTRDVRALSGLRAKTPWLAFAAVAAALSMSGAPPTLGFISKELLYEYKLNLPIARHLVAAFGVLANSLAVVVALIVGVRPFIGKPGQAGVDHSPGMGMVMPSVLLAALGLGLGLVPKFLDKILITPATEAMGFDAKAAKMTLWHGFTPVLALSVLTLILGFGLYRIRKPLRKITIAAGQWAGVMPSALYTRVLAGTLGLAEYLTHRIQHGHLRLYVRVTLLATSILIFLGLGRSVQGFSQQTIVPPGVFETVLVLMLSVSAIAAVRAKSRLSAILCLGDVGYSVAILFATFSAPDLAITQLLVETLTVVLFSFVILKLPQMRKLSKPKTRLADALVATVAGLAMTLVVWKSVHVQTHDPISPGMVERSVPEAYGSNVVNVILVDFRALDTLGEIVVLALACLGVTALLVRRRVQKGSITSDLKSERGAF